MSHYVPKDPLLWRIMPKLSGLAGCLVLLLWTVVLVPFVPLILCLQYRRRVWFVNTLAEQGRVLSWNDFLNRTTQSVGSIIVEVGNKRCTRFWWSADRILAQSPMAPPKYSELNKIAYGGAEYHSFARWCYENYLTPQHGHAMLVWPVEADFETFPFDPDYDAIMQQRFPNQDVVIVTFYDTRYA